MEGDLVKKHQWQRDQYWVRLLALRGIIDCDFPCNPELVADTIAARIGVLRDQLEGRLEKPCQRRD